VQTRALPRTRFLGWDTVVGGAGLQLLQAAIFYQSFGVFVVAWTEEFGWSSAAVAGGYALVTLQGGLLGPVQGWLLERFGVRRVILVGLVALCGGLGMLSLVSTLPAFYAAMFVTGIGLALAGFLSITTGVVPWFVRRRSTALSLMAVGISLGGLLVPLVAAATVDIGWRSTLQISALTTLLAGLPLAALMRRGPSAYGQVADGPAARPAHVPGRVRVPGDRAPDGDFTLAQALRTRTFWLLGAAHGAAMLVVGAVTVHLIPHLSGGMGYSLQGAASIVALLTLVTGAGQLIGGPLGDRFDKRVIAAVAMLAHAVALLVLAWGQGAVAVGTFALVHGLAWGIRGPLMGSIRADYFGIRHFGSIMGASSLLFMTGNLIGPVLAGTLADTLGDYRLGFTVMAMIAASSSIVFWWARPPLPPALP
jgi:MFS family permease